MLNAWWQSQFERPRGLGGRIAGQVMALGNARMARLAVEVLRPSPDARILELACGPGVALALLARRARVGLIAGVDVSQQMVDQARRRIWRRAPSARVALQRADVTALPWPDATFDAVFEMNAFKQFPDAPRALAEARRVLRSGGRLLLLVRMRPARQRPLAAPGNTCDDVEEIIGEVRRAGFRSIATERRDAGRVVVCVLAHR